jgi:hypothetical protein
MSLHWSLLAGAAVAGGFAVRPGAWLGYALVLLTHVAGHALVAAVSGRRVEVVRVHASGGSIGWSGVVTAEQRGLVAWGGLLAQGLLLGGAALWPAPPEGTFAGDLRHALVLVNGVVLAVNALPFPGTDGFDALRLLVFPEAPFTLPRRAPRPAKKPRAKGLEAEVEQLELELEMAEFLDGLAAEVRREAGVAQRRKRSAR